MIIEIRYDFLYPSPISFHLRYPDFLFFPSSTPDIARITITIITIMIMEMEEKKKKESITALITRENGRICQHGRKEEEAETSWLYKKMICDL